MHNHVHTIEQHENDIRIMQRLLGAFWLRQTECGMVLMGTKHRHHTRPLEYMITAVDRRQFRLTRGTNHHQFQVRSCTPLVVARHMGDSQTPLNKSANKRNVKIKYDEAYLEVRTRPIALFGWWASEQAPLLQRLRHKAQRIHQKGLQ